MEHDGGQEMKNTKVVDTTELGWLRGLVQKKTRRYLDCLYDDHERNLFLKKSFLILIPSAVVLQMISS